MEKTRKKELVEEYKKIFEDASIGILVEPQGLNVEQVTEIRKTLNTSGSEFRVLKNRIAKIAAKDTAYSEISDNFTDMRAFIHSDSDPIELAKIVAKFADKLEQFKLNSALMKTGQQVTALSAKDVVNLSKLPSREELIAKLLFIMNAPVTNFARVLNEVPASFARVVQAIADNKN